MSIAARLRVDYPAFSLDVDLDLPASGITALFGPSGCGKTTLLRAIAGLERATGRLVVNDETWQDGTTFMPTHRRPIGYVFQEASLFPHLTVRGNLDYARRRAASADIARPPRSQNLLTLLGIEPLLDRRPNELSGGERQRVAIARALLSKPRLLLMDEPLAALDLARKQEILPYLESLHRELDLPVLYVSHAPDEVARLADHLVVLDAGRAVAAGPLTETLTRLDLPIKLGEDTGVVLAGHVAARDEQWHLARIDCGGLDFWVRDAGHPVGQSVRVRILARDVSLALAAPTDSSILNLLPAEVAEMATDGHPAQALVKLKAGDAALLARVTQRSVQALGLMPGRQVCAQVKAVALLA